MSGKQITIAVGAKDQASSTLKTVGSSIVKLGAVSVVTTKAMSSLLPSIGKLGIAGAAAIAAVPAGVSAAAYGVLRMVNTAAESLDNLGAIQARTGMSAEGLSELAYAAKMSNLDVETLAGTVAVAQKNISQFVRTGGGRAADAIKALGVNMRGANGNMRDMSELLPEIADALLRIKSPGTRGELIDRIFGSREALQLLGQGSAQLRAFAQQAKALGVVFSQDQIDAADNYRDALDRIGEASMGVKVQLMTVLAPTLTTVANLIARSVSMVPEVITNATKAAREVYNGTEAGKLIESQLQTIFDRASVIAKVGTVGVGRVVLAAGLQAASSISGVIFERIEGDLTYRLKRVGIMFGAGIDAAITRAFKGDKAADDMLAGVANLLNQVERNMTPLSSSMEVYESHLTDSSLLGSAMKRTTQELGSALSTNLPVIWSNLDAILQLSEAWAKAGFDVAGLEEQVRRMRDRLSQGPDSSATTEWLGFINGIKAGYEDLAKEADNTYNVGREMFGVLGSGTRDLAAGTIDAVKGAQSLGDAFKNAGAKAVESLAQVALQLVYVRILSAALGAIGGAFSGGGAAVDSEMFKMGGIGRQLATSAPRYASGGIIPGTPQNRDTKLIMAASGERMLNRNQIGRLGGNARIDQALRGGDSIGGGGGNVSITVSPTIVVQGNYDKVSAQQTANTMAAMVIKAVEGSPAMRSRFRGAIA